MQNISKSWKTLENSHIFEKVLEKYFLKGRIHEISDIFMLN